MASSATATSEPSKPSEKPEKPSGKVNLDALRELLDGRWASVRADVRAQIGERRVAPDPEWSTERHRAYISELTQELADSGRPALGFTSEYGGADDIGGSVVSIQMLAQADLSLMVKAGVQWGLFGGAVQALRVDRRGQGRGHCSSICRAGAGPIALSPAQASSVR